uniref:Uncharacterized protein n=1 Tax=Parascaris univalens TaxID=6257 RepID=A0A915CIF3_PARUN
RYVLLSNSEMSEEGSTQTEEVNSQRTKGQRSQSPIGGWSWNCLTCWRKKKPAPGLSTQCSVANDNILVDKTESVTEMQTDDSGPCSETSVAADTTRPES